MPFLPLTTEEMRERGWDAPDAVVVTGDAYVDHPSFGAAGLHAVPAGKYRRFHPFRPAPPRFFHRRGEY